MIASEYLKVGKQARLGFGAMRMPQFDEVCKMVDAYLDGGHNFFDTAWIYGGSEEALRKAVVERHARDKFLLADKLPPWEVKNHADSDKLFQEQLRRTGLDYFDFYLLHSIDNSREKDVEDKGLWDWILDQKKKGLVKHAGFSFHGTADCLERLLAEHTEMEFVLLQLNYMDILRGPAGDWHKLALKYKKPIFVMEPIKGGTLATLPAPAEKLLKDYDPTRSIASWAMQYSANLEGVTCVFSGMSNLGHVQDNLKTFENMKPLTAEELTLLENVLVETSKVSSVPCTACKYCHNDCPIGINIAECFSLYNEVKRSGVESDWNRSLMYNVLPEGTRAADCTSCGACLAHCPQGIDIPKDLGLVAGLFE